MKEFYANYIYTAEGETITFVSQIRRKTTDSIW